ncbi:hypothetical protein ACWDA3_56060 [Nonomuraea rubra]
MRTVVEVPIRVRLDTALLEGDAAPLVADAVRAAAGRALAASAAVVLADRPGCAPAPVEPSFSWHGSGLPLVRARDRNAVETAVTGGLLAALAATDLRPPPGARDRARDGGEPVDPERHAPLVRRYVVDSYQGGGAPAAIEIQMEPEEITSGSWSGILDSPDPEWDEAGWNDALLVSARQAGQGRPASGLMALLFAGGEGVAGLRLFAVRDLRPGGVSVTEHSLGITNLRSFEIDERGRTAEHHLTLGPGTRGVLRALGDTPDEQSRTALLRDWMTMVRGARFDQERARLVKTLGEDRFEQIKQAELERLAHLNADPPPVVGYVELEVRDRRFLISLTAQFGHRKGTEIPIVPLTGQAEVGEGAAGDGAATDPDAAKDPALDLAADLAPSGSAPKEQGGTGRPGSTGTAEEGGFVEIPGLDDDGGTRLFPRSSGDEPTTCTPFLKEPPLAALGQDGDRLRVLIERIAGKLAIPACEYAGGFTLSAAEAFGGRATDIGNFSVTASEAYLKAPPAGGQGNLGTAHFTPAPSPLIAFLRHLGGVAPDLTELVDTIEHVYRKPEHHGKIGFLDNPLSWVIRLRYRVNDTMRWSVAVLFAMACRVLMVQLLKASAGQIQGRLDRLPLLTDYFEQIILPRLRGIQDLIELRDLVRNAPRTPQLPERPSGGTPDPAPPPPADAGTDGHREAWLRARADLTEALGGTTEPPPGTPPRGTIIWPVTGDPRLHDGRGRTWSLHELEERIVTVRGDLESVDPLVKQLTDLDDVMERFTDGRVGEELERLLKEMLSHNRDEQKKVQDSWRYAFQASRITTGLPTAPGTGHRLEGIHLQAHQAIGDAFRGDPFYAMGIDMLFGVERGRLGLKAFAEFAGLLLLSVVCPPLAVVAGIVVAGAQLYEAVQREHLYRSMLDPELVLSRAEVEAELFAARLGFVLSVVLAVVPNARSLLRTGAQAARVAEVYGVATAARLTAARFTAHLAEEGVRSLRNGFVVAVVRELVQDEVVDQIAQRVLGPIVADIEREVTMTGPVGGAAGARRLVDRLLREERR